MLAPAPSLPSPDALLVPLTAGAAYAADVVRLNGREPIGPADDAWLALAHALGRAADLPAAQRATVLVAGADGVTALLPAADAGLARSALVAAADGLRSLAGEVGRAIGGASRPALDADDAAARLAAVGALQAVVAQQEQAGSFLLAFSTLAAVRVALAPVLDRRAEGLLLAQQGRVARQLGAMATAAELYGASVRAARAAKAPDVAARALIGGGSLASMRGNYPEARALFRRGLSAAIRAGADEHTRAAHHGLLVAALAARDVETALAHGWAAFKDTSPQSPDERAEMLVNLGELGRYAGEFRATLGACLSAIELTDTPRLRLAALSTAASAAAELGETRLLAFVARELERTIVRSGQSYENARALVALAEAYARVGLPAVAQELADRAATLAAEGQFHEVVVALDALRVVIGGRRMSRPAHRRAQECWSTATRKVFLSLERLPSAALRSELAGVGAT